MALTPSSLIPENDAARVEALRRYQILDATNERILDELTQLTAKLFRTPIALLSLVEEKEVLFKGNYGLPGAERAARHLSMCSAAVLQDDSLVFKNLDEKPCELTDPLLANQLNLKFYAGHAIKTSDGYNIGTLCVIDRQPRSFSPADDAMLTTLAGVAMGLLDLRLALGATATTSFKLWEPIYRAIEPLVKRLGTLGEYAYSVPSVPPPITPEMIREASAIADILDKHIAAALQRV